MVPSAIRSSELARVAGGLTGKINLNVKHGRCSPFASPDLRVTILRTTGGQPMRWYVSIGAVLVAGALAGGDSRVLPRRHRGTSSDRNWPTRKPTDPSMSS